MAEKCYKCGHDMTKTSTGLLVCPLCHDQRYPRTIYNPAVESELSRAEDLRMQRDFDRAICIYENILSKDDNNYAAHWGLFLSKYGILYVNDPKTHKRIPNINRIHKISVKDDPDFLKACQKAPRNLGMQYATEGKVIDDWFRQLLHRIANQPPYDIFICYKETNDITRARTDDSYLAHDLYNALKGEGYNVFFANQSIHAGDYEPQIYAAIITAKVMLVVATKKEYAESTWVKNEWSRFNDLISRGEKKKIINVYDSNAVSLPNEIAGYQAYSKRDINFINKLKSEIDKCVKKVPVQQKAAAATVNNYINRGNLALENGNYSEANANYEKALDLDYSCADAYIGKLKADFRTTSIDSLKNSQYPLSNNANFKNAVKFASPQIKAQLLQCENYVQKNLDRKEFDRLNSQIPTISSKAGWSNLISSYKTITTIPASEKNRKTALCKQMINDIDELERLKKRKEELGEKKKELLNSCTYYNKSTNSIGAFVIFLYVLAGIITIASFFVSSYLAKLFFDTTPWLNNVLLFFAINLCSVNVLVNAFYLSSESGKVGSVNRNIETIDKYIADLEHDIKIREDELNKKEIMKKSLKVTSNSKHFKEVASPSVMKSLKNKNPIEILRIITFFVSLLCLNIPLVWGILFAVFESSLGIFYGFAESIISFIASLIFLYPYLFALPRQKNLNIFFASIIPLVFIIVPVIGYIGVPIALLIGICFLFL